MNPPVSTRVWRPARNKKPPCRQLASILDAGTSRSLHPDVGADAAEFQDDPTAVDCDVVPYRVHSRNELLIELVNLPRIAKRALGSRIDLLRIKEAQIAARCMRGESVDDIAAW